MNRIELKNKAKRALKTGITPMMIAYFILMMLTYGFQFIAISYTNKAYLLLVVIAEMLVMTPLYAGVTKLSLDVSNELPASVAVIFSKYSVAFRFIWASILSSIKILLWSLLLIVPGIIASFRYSLVVYIMVENPNISANDALKQSSKMMHSHKMEFFILRLSFILWILLSVLTLGIALFWVIPYMEVTSCNFYNSLKSNNQEPNTVL